MGLITVVLDQSHNMSSDQSLSKYTFPLVFIFVFNVIKVTESSFIMLTIGQFK